LPEEKCFSQRLMEGFGLEFPKDADKFLEIFERFSEGGTLGQLHGDLAKAFPEKSESILSVPVYAGAEAW